MTTNIIGGAPGYIAQLSMLNKNTPLENGRMFSQWSGSVKNFPKVIKTKVCLETIVKIWLLYANEFVIIT